MGNHPATLVVVLPEDVNVFTSFLVNVTEVTPDELYEVLLVDLGANEDVLAMARSIEGDVALSDQRGLGSQDGIQQAVNESATGEVVVIFGNCGAELREGWLDQVIVRIKAGETLIDPISTGIPAVAAHRSQFGPKGLETGPATQDDLGPQFANDTSMLVQLEASGKAAVGQLPLDVAERIRERMAMEEERRLLEIARNGKDVCWTDEGVDEPLVTVRIPTYNRGQIVVDTAINSVLAQTYEHWELIVVGDNCDEATEKAVRSVADPRIQFLNMPVRGVYPNDPWQRWLVAGVPPINHAIDMARGSWIAPIDDDDEFTDDHIEVLLNEARTRRLELVWSKAAMETDKGWGELGAEPLGPGNVVHGSVFYSAGLRFMKMSNTCWKLDEPADGNFWRRMRSIGVRTGFLDRVTYRHNLESRFREDLGRME